MKKGNSPSWTERGEGAMGAESARAGRLIRETLFLTTIWISIWMEEKPGPGIAADPSASAKAGQDHKQGALPARNTAAILRR